MARRGGWNQMDTRDTETLHLPIKPQAPNPNLHGVQFSYEKRPDPEGSGRMMHHVMAHVEGRQKPVGTLWWHPNTGEIKGIGTVPEMGGKGVATAMWHRAHWESRRTNVEPVMQGQQSLFPAKDYTERSRIVAPQHSKIRTDQGNKWAKSVGGTIPPRPPISRMLRAAMDLGDF